MAFDRTVATPAVDATSAERLEFSVPAAPRTILERVEARETQAGVAIEMPQKKVTVADVLFATLVTALSLIAALAGIVAAVFLIGLGFSIFVVPMIASVGLGVTFFSAVLLVFRKEVRNLSAPMARKMKRSESVDLFETA